MALIIQGEILIDDDDDDDHDDDDDDGYSRFDWLSLTIREETSP